MEPKAKKKKPQARQPSVSFYIATSDAMEKAFQYKIGICGSISNLEKRYQTYGMRIIFFVRLSPECDPKKVESWLLEEKFKNKRSTNEHGRLTEIICGVPYHLLLKEVLYAISTNSVSWREATGLSSSTCIIS